MGMFEYVLEQMRNKEWKKMDSHRDARGILFSCSLVTLSVWRNRIPEESLKIILLVYRKAQVIVV